MKGGNLGKSKYDNWCRRCDHYENRRRGHYENEKNSYCDMFRKKPFMPCLKHTAPFFNYRIK